MNNERIQILFCFVLLMAVLLLSGALYYKIESHEKIEMEKLRIVEKYYQETIDSYEGKNHELK